MNQDEIKKLQKYVHCAECGNIEPQIIKYSENDVAGFTECCQEDACQGLEKYYFKNKKVSVKACCWAVAERKFEIQNIDILKEEGMSRIPIEDYE